MKFIHTLWDKFKRDTTLGRVVKNSGFLLVSNLISAVISIITANLVGVTVFGVIGIITSFITNVNQLLSFRMADVVVRYMGDFYARKEYEPGCSGRQGSRNHGSHDFHCCLSGSSAVGTSWR